MTSITARQFILSKIERGHIPALHVQETKMGRNLTPYELAEKYRVQSFDVTEEAVSRFERIINGIYYELRRDMKEECVKENSEWSEVALTHWVDDAVIRREVDFSGIEQKRASAGILERVQGAKHYASVAE